MIDILIVFALLASAITTNKILLIALPPIFFVGLRMVFAGAILLAISFYQKNQVTLKTILADALILSVITLSTTYLPAIFKAYALQSLPSAKAAFFGTLDPFVTALYTYLLFHEKLTLKKTVGILIGFCGAYVLLISDAPAGNQFMQVGIFSLPELAALGSVAVGRLGWLMIQKLLHTGRYTPIQITSITMCASGILSLVTAYCIETVPGFAFANWQLPLLFFYTVIVGNVISLTSYAHLLKKYSATLLSLAGFLIPLFVAVYGKIWLKEPLSLYFFEAMILTFIGLILFSYDSLSVTQKS